MAPFSVTRLYVGNLPNNATERDVTKAFERYGRIVRCNVKRTGPSGGSPFAFIEYENPRDAEDALKEKDGSELDGCRLRVEVPFNCRSRNGGRRNIPPRRGKYVIEITGIPPSGSWQDLKDHFRDVAECGHADVFDGGVGEASFFTRSEMEQIIEQYDGSVFRSHDGERSRINIAEKSMRGRSYSRGRRGRSYSRSDSRRGSSRYSDRRKRYYSPEPRRRRYGSRDRDRENDRHRDRSRDRDRYRSRERSRYRDRSVDKYSRSKSREDRDREKSLENDRTPDRTRTHDRDQSSLRDRSVDRERTPEKDRSRSIASRSASRSVHR